MTPPWRPVPDLDHPLGSAGAMAQVAASQIGYREGPNNDTIYGLEYGLNHQPWCAMFLSRCARRAGVGTDVIPNFAYTPAGADWFRSRGHLFSTPQVGDVAFVYYASMGRIGHTFLVESIFTTEAGVRLMRTVEGNTNDSGSSQGIGVFRLIRADTSNLSYGRPAYATGYLPSDPGGEVIDPPSESDEEEDDMPQYIQSVDPPGDDTIYGYTASEWWIATETEAGSFQPDGPRHVNAVQRERIKARVLATGRRRHVGTFRCQVEGKPAQYLVSGGVRLWIPDGAALVEWGADGLVNNVVDEDHAFMQVPLVGPVPPG